MLQQRYDDAELLFGEVLDARTRILGEDHPETLISMNDLAYLLLSDERDRDAEELFDDALERHRRVLGDYHPFTLTVLNNLAALLQGQGRIEEAEPLLVVGLRASRAVHGDVHETTMSLLNGLASIYLEQELFADAEETYLEALELGRKLFVPDHPNTLMVLENLVVVLQREAKLDDAELQARELMLLTPRDDAAYARRSGLLERIRGQLERATRGGWVASPTESASFDRLERPHITLSQQEASTVFRRELVIGGSFGARAVGTAALAIALATTVSAQLDVIDSAQKVSEDEGVFLGGLSSGDRFGSAVGQRWRSLRHRQRVRARRSARHEFVQCGGGRRVARRARVGRNGR